MRSTQPLSCVKFWLHQVARTPDHKDNYCSAERRLSEMDEVNGGHRRKHLGAQLPPSRFSPVSSSRTRCGQALRDKLSLPSITCLTCVLFAFGVPINSKIILPLSFSVLPLLWTLLRPAKPRHNGPPCHTRTRVMTQWLLDDAIELSGCHLRSISRLHRAHRTQPAMREDLAILQYAPSYRRRNAVFVR